MEILKDVLRGAVIGTANIIPGVSGGTMALVLGIYEKLIDAVKSISPASALSFFKLFTFSREGAAEFRREMRKLDLPFLAAICIGAFGAILVSAELMTWLLENRHDPTYGFFFGLVLLSVYAPYRLIKNKRSAAAILPCIIAAAGLIALSSLSPASIQEKTEYGLQTQHEYHTDKEAVETLALGQTKAAEKKARAFSAARPVFFFCAGAIAISAMILPGISGSFILLLLGGYFELLRALTERDVPVLLAFSIGCIVGLALFTRLLNFLLIKFYDGTMSFLVGLVIGSLWEIWPFKASVPAGGETVYTENILPASFGGNELATLIAFISGCITVSFFFILEHIVYKSKSMK